MFYRKRLILPILILVTTCIISVSTADDYGLDEEILEQSERSYNDRSTSTSSRKPLPNAVEINPSTSDLGGSYAETPINIPTIPNLPPPPGGQFGCGGGMGPRFGGCGGQPGPIPYAGQFPYGGGGGCGGGGMGCGLPPPSLPPPCGSPCGGSPCGGPPPSPCGRTPCGSPCGGSPCGSPCGGPPPSPCGSPCGGGPPPSPCGGCGGPRPCGPPPCGGCPNFAQRPCSPRPPCFQPPPPICAPPPPCPIPQPCPRVMIPPPPCACGLPPPPPSPCGFGGCGGGGVGFPVPQNDCCCNCQRPCRSRNRHRARASGVRNSFLDQMEESSTKCNSIKLREIIKQNIDKDLDYAKRSIQSAAQHAFGKSINVICGTGEFSYVAHTDVYCQYTMQQVTCYAFRPI